jgi:CRP-like cAMP-binding protein
MMEQLRKYFERYTKIPDEDWDLFCSRLERKEFPKKRLLLAAGQTEHYLGFMEKGVIRYFIPKDDNELTFEFAFENSFVNAYDSFLKRTPSIYSIETLSETVLWRINYNDLQYVYANTGIGNKIGRYAAEELYLKKSKREKSLLNETAEQRYLKLFTEQPHLIKQIPLRYIASYIGITPQALSRIRRRIY